MPGFDVDGLDFADEIRGDAPRARRWPLVAILVLIVAALICIGLSMAHAKLQIKATAQSSWVPAPRSTERGFASLTVYGSERP